MPASITFTDVRWSPVGNSGLFENLNLAFTENRVGLVGRNGIGKTSLLRLITGELKPLSGKVAVEGTIGVLRQQTGEATDETIADLFGSAEDFARLERIENGEATDEDIDKADWTLQGRVSAALSTFGLALPLSTKLSSLSGGQRTRAALATLTFSEPDFILLDEPTNNLDGDGRLAVHGLLEKWKRGAIVISHDRELLEKMDAIVELTSHGAKLYGGNWTSFHEQKELELSAARHELADARKHADEVARSAQLAAEKKARKDGTGKQKAGKGDLPRILSGGRKNNSENTGGQLARTSERRMQAAQRELSAARERIEIIQPLTVDIPSTRLPANKTVLILENISAGYLPDQPVIGDFSLTIVGAERIAIHGPNGSGKSTLVSVITGTLAPFSGKRFLGVPFAFLDQHVRLLEPALSIRDNFLRLHPGTNENDCRASLARFMFRADSALKTVGTLSGGERLRAGLACALGGGNPPPLLILDEPTNHLDIHSIEAVEAGLKSYDGALLVVSHDKRFLETIAIRKFIDLNRDRLP